MTLRCLQKRINEYATEHPGALDDEVVIDENWLTVGEFIADEEFNMCNGLEKGQAHWDCGPSIIRLPKDITKEVNNG